MLLGCHQRTLQHPSVVLFGTRTSSLLEIQFLQRRIFPTRYVQTSSSLNEGGQSDVEDGDNNVEFVTERKVGKLNYYKYKLWGSVAERSIPKSPHALWKHNRLPEPTPQTSAGMQMKKVSKHGSTNSLFLDCLDRIRDARRYIEEDAENGAGIRTQRSPEIEELTKIEKSIIYKVLKRVDPTKEVAPNLEFSGDYIDPYWSPFRAIDNVKKEIHDEFSAFSRLHSTAEAIRQRDLLRRKYRIEYGLLDPLSGQKDRSRLDTSIPDDPKYPQFKSNVPEKFWDPATLRRKVLFNNNRPITWRDLHILKFFIAETGMFLPRRLTMATRRQQIRAYRAVKQAQGMGVFPLHWRPPDTEQMIMQDPMQFLCDILTLRFKEKGDLRAEAMVKSMMARFKTVDYRQYLIHAGKLRRQREKRAQQQREENQGNFSRIMRLYGTNKSRRRKTASPI